MFASHIAYARIEALDYKKLSLEHFPSLVEAFEAADVLFKQCAENHPEQVANHPPILFPGMPQLDQFWLIENTGIYQCMHVIPSDGGNCPHIGTSSCIPMSDGGNCPHIGTSSCIPMSDCMR